MEGNIGLSSGKEKYRIYSAHNISFPDHIHRTYEVMIGLKGQTITKIDGKEYTLGPGDCAVIFPLQHHSFTVDCHSLVKICLFSTDYIPEFEQLCHGLYPEAALFKSREANISFPDMCSPLSVRAFFYVLCSVIARHVKLIPNHQMLPRSSAIEKVLLYVDERFCEDCSLASAAEALGYEYTYLSRLFKKTTGYSFCEYLNRFRIDRACYLLTDSSMEVTAVALEVGYSSVRTFNREFMKIMCSTPTEYRNLYSAG